MHNWRSRGLRLFSMCNMRVDFSLPVDTIFFVILQTYIIGL